MLAARGIWSLANRSVHRAPEQPHVYLATMPELIVERGKQKVTDRT